MLSLRLSLPRWSRACGLPLLLVGTAGCDRVKAALNPPQVDAAWQVDSALLATNPTVLFRVDRSQRDARVIPIATVGPNGARALSLGDRGWRAFDINYLQRTASLVPYLDGEPLGVIHPTRGMWDGTPLDSLPCPSPVPAGLVSVDASAELLTSGNRALPGPTANKVSDAELQAVLSSVSTLVAPTAGISLSRLAQYRRRVHIVATGTSTSPTIVVTYDDPRFPADSQPSITDPPHHLTVVLDKGAYGYRPSHMYADVLGSSVRPRRKFLGALDADGDGKAELYFGLQLSQFPLVTYSYRFDGDAWIEAFKYERGRCQ